MKKFILLISICLYGFYSIGQTPKLYNPAEDAEKEIAKAIKTAKAEKKHVLIQAGGNWCSWCIEFARFSKADAQIDSVIKASYVLYHLNWSKENENKKLLAKYQYPQRFGFPVFIVLNAKGERIHTQNSSYLEDGKKSYNNVRVQEFLEMWAPRAVNPAMYSTE
ncbi:MAG: thioredoxin family protein [Ferruginibacter sp.]